MKISQFIEQLEELMEREGDIEIVSRQFENLPPRLDVVDVKRPTERKPTR